jgi:hypothetical protein
MTQDGEPQNAHEEAQTWDGIEARAAEGTPPFCDTLVGAIAAARIVAKKCGYAIAHHGSLARDIDLIAAPWTDDAKPAHLLVDSIVSAVGGWINPTHPNPVQKPHGRLAWSIHLLGYGTYIDLSVMPLKP